MSRRSSSWTAREVAIVVMLAVVAARFTSGELSLSAPEPVTVVATPIGRTCVEPGAARDLGLRADAPVRVEAVRYEYSERSGDWIPKAVPYDVLVTSAGKTLRVRTSLLRPCVGSTRTWNVPAGATYVSGVEELVVRQPMPVTVIVNFEATVAGQPRTMRWVSDGITEATIIT